MLTTNTFSFVLQRSSVYCFTERCHHVNSEKGKALKDKSSKNNIFLLIPDVPVHANFVVMMKNENSGPPFSGL